MSRRFRLTDAAIRKALDALAQDHSAVARAIAQVGYPPSRRREHSFESLARIVMGQQLSVKAAATIAQRVDDTVGGTLQPESLLATTPDKLRAAGLSRQKIGYLQSLAEAV
ncbi:MAG: DNA-3-methyladenine glycosylase 2 family protein, partial [Luminiphilus sp.]